MLNHLVERVDESRITRFVFGFTLSLLLIKLIGELTKVAGMSVVVLIWGFGVSLMAIWYLLYPDLLKLAGSGLGIFLWNNSIVDGSTWTYVSDLWLVAMPLFVCMVAYEELHIHKLEQRLLAVQNFTIGLTMSLAVPAFLELVVGTKDILSGAQVMDITVSATVLVCTLLYRQKFKAWFSFHALVGFLAFPIFWGVTYNLHKIVLITDLSTLLTSALFTGFAAFALGVALQIIASRED